MVSGQSPVLVEAKGIPAQTIEPAKLPFSDQFFFRVNNSDITNNSDRKDAPVTIPAYRIQFNLDKVHIVSAHLAKPEAQEAGQNFSFAEIIRLNKEGTGFASGDFVESKMDIEDKFVSELLTNYAPAAGDQEIGIIFRGVADGIRLSILDQSEKIDRVVVKSRIENDLSELRKQQFLTREEQSRIELKKSKGKGGIRAKINELLNR